jgi:methanethiol S-methyltransferase
MAWLVSALLLWGLIHSILASLTAKEHAERWFGAEFMRFYRLLYNAFSVISFVIVLGIAALTPDRILYNVPFPWYVFMLIGETLAVAGLVSGLLHTDAWAFLGLRQLGESKGPSKLTTSGLYHYVRHPLYAAGLLFIWLLPKMTANVLAINIALTIYIMIGAFFEERKLRHEFGRAYSDYAAVTPMLIPFTKRNKSSHKVNDL